MSMYGRKTQLVDSAKAFLEKVVTWSNYIMQAVCDARQRMSSNLTARMTNGLTWCKEIIWRDKLESRGHVDGKTMDKNIVMIQRIYRGRLGRKDAEREWYNEQSFVEKKRHTKDQVEVEYGNSGGVTMPIAESVGITDQSSSTRTLLFSPDVADALLDGQCSGCLTMPITRTAAVINRGSPMQTLRFPRGQTENINYQDTWPGAKYAGKVSKQISEMAVGFALESYKIQTDQSKSNADVGLNFINSGVLCGVHNRRQQAARTADDSLTWVLKRQTGSQRNNLAEYTEVHVNLLQNMAFTQISQWERLSRNLATVISAEANLTLSSFMLNELTSSYHANLDTTNLCYEYRKMKELHCQHGIRGHHPDCKMCNWINRSLECTYIDWATGADVERDCRLTIAPGGLLRELKNIRLGHLTRHGTTGFVDNDGLRPIAQIRDAGCSRKLARRGSVLKWKIDGKDQSISGAIYEYSMKSQSPPNTRLLTIPGESGGVTTPITTELLDTRPLAIPGESGGVMTPTTTDPIGVLQLSSAEIIIQDSNREQADQSWLRNNHELGIRVIIHDSNREPADQPWLATNEGNLGALQHRHWLMRAQLKRRLDNLQMSYYVTKKGDTWLKICTALNIGESDRRSYYEWISKYHGYGSVKHDDAEIPWMEFENPYSDVRPDVTEFQHGLPFPLPHGGDGFV